MDRRVTESERLELENKLLHRTAEPISLRLGLLEYITSNFSKEQEIGSGGYGVVYKGILSCGSVIAIKKFNGRIPEVDDRSFENEASFLMDIKHHNVVQLLGFCAESRGAMMMKQPNGKGIVVHEQTRMLCFEYMCNGGLDKHLSDESSGLEWNTRYKIIKGICSGLKYLHGRNIIHLDLKPQNILMDATMTPKIADFGLSRLLGEQKSYTVTSNRPGTRGYMAPEYTDRGVISKKADIFSLGVIIIEILKGCKDDYPDYRLSTEIDFQHFREKVLSNWRNRFEREPRYTALELHTRLVKQCIDVALECVQPDKKKRPNVSNIIEILNAADGSCCDQKGENLPVDHQTDITPLSDLRQGILDYKICVRVSRMWEFKGNDEQQDTKHLDLVLIDQKDDSIYAEIPRDVIPYVKPHLEEGKIIVMSKITVERAKPSYRVVQNPYMIKLNRRTCIKEAINQAPDFPKYTFSLIPFDKLPSTKSTDYFIDVIGKIIGVSNASAVCTTNGSFLRRVVQLQDQKGNIIELSQAGARALEFDGDAVLEVGQNHHVIAIFVGTLMKLYQHKYRFLSGSSACRWYINENDIPAIKSFQRSLTGPVIPIQRLQLQGGYDGKQDFEKRTLMQLQTIDPFTEKANMYECTVTISDITEGQTWCYRACRVCSSRMRLEPNKCTKEGCSSTQFDWKYKIPFLGTDETYMLEFVFFEKRGTQLIGKTAENLYKQYKPTEIPPEISTWIGHKFTFVVRILSNKSIKAVDPSFVVVRIKKRFGRQSITPETGAVQNISGRSTIKEQDLPLLVPTMSKRKPVQSSQIPPDGDIEDNMDIETSEDWNEKDASNKRAFKKTKYDSQEGTNDEHKERDQENKVKKQR